MSLFIIDGNNFEKSLAYSRGSKLSVDVSLFLKDRWKILLMADSSSWLGKPWVETWVSIADVPAE